MADKHWLYVNSLDSFLTPLHNPHSGPVLVIQGSHDRVVPYTYAERYVERYKDATLKIIPDEDHSFTKNTAEAALYASDWLAKQINR